MGQGKIKSRSKAQVLAGETRCIYCSSTPDSLEHMPPVGMFLARDRPSGMEYATCKQCNNGTRSADLVASIFARLRYSPQRGDAMTNEAKGLLRKSRTIAPGVEQELLRDSKHERAWRENNSGVLVDSIKITADGPLVRCYLNVFAAKLSFAMFKEHTRAPLPLDGAAIGMWYLNVGVPKPALAILDRILPESRSLQKGSRSVAPQFEYRFSTDGSSIVSAITRLHEGLFIFSIAASDAQLLSGFPQGPTTAFARPGELVGMLPQRAPQGPTARPILRMRGNGLWVPAQS